MIRLWDVRTGGRLVTLEGHSGGVGSVAFSPDGFVLGSGSFDQTIRLWDARTGQPKQTLEGHTHHIKSVTFSPDGSTLASGSYDNTIRLWDAVTGKHKRTLLGSTGGIVSFAYSPDGRMLASGSSDGTILLWLLSNIPYIIEPLRPLHTVSATYPQRARRAGREGVVLLEASIGVDGIARDIKVIRGIGFGCNKAAIETLKASRFIPAKSRGTLIV